MHVVAGWCGGVTSRAAGVGACIWESRKIQVVGWVCKKTQGKGSHSREASTWRFLQRGREGENIGVGGPHERIVLRHMGTCSRSL